MPDCKNFLINYNGSVPPQEYVGAITAGNYSSITVVVPPGTKATPFFAALEDCGYRMSSQQGIKYFFYRLSTKTNDVFTQELDKDELARLSPYLERLPYPMASVAGSALALDFLTAKRFDIAIKSHYARQLKHGAAKAWREYAYLWHLRKITGGAALPREHDGSGKEGDQAFLASFAQLIFANEPEKLPPVPVDRNNVAFDGAHRIAAAIACGREVRYVRLDTDSPCDASSEFFRSEKCGGPCPEAILDAAAIEYCRKKGLALALIFPTVRDTGPALRHLGKIAQLVHTKRVFLSPSAGGRLLRQVYLGHAWFSAEANSGGFKDKQQSCFPYAGEVLAVLLDGFLPGDLRRAKERIRAEYGIGNHSIHITDSDEETLRVARILFNETSLLFLHGRPNQEDELHASMEKYQNWLRSTGQDEELFCVDGGAVLALLGMRAAKDIDFLWLGDEQSLPKPPKGIDCHNSQSHHYPWPLPDVIMDPSSHGWYMGLKICSPEALLAMKRARGEAKDKADVAWLQNFLTAHGRTSRSLWRVKATLLYTRLQAVLFRIKRALKRPLRPLVRKLRSLR